MPLAPREEIERIKRDGWGVGAHQRVRFFDHAPV
jgi:hypothetical protein